MTHFDGGDRASLRGATLLIVEDCGATAESLRLMARACGMRARVATSLDAARRHLAVFRPSAVLVDLGLPDGDGASLLRGLAGDAGSRPALLAVSGDPSALAAPDIDRLADARIEKPVAGVAALVAALAPFVRPALPDFLSVPGKMRPLSPEPAQVVPGI
jgi:DNA-binding response OmpR family regulator